MHPDEARRRHRTACDMTRYSAPCWCPSPATRRVRHPEPKRGDCVSGDPGGLPYEKVQRSPLRGPNGSTRRMATWTATAPGISSRRTPVRLYQGDTLWILRCVRRHRRAVMRVMDRVARHAQDRHAPLRGIPPTALERKVEGGRPRGRTVGLPPSASGGQKAHFHHPTPATPAHSNSVTIQRRGRASYARPASSNSWTASWLFSATATCAARISPSTSARAWDNSSGSPSHHSASDAIASSARSGSPWTYSARYSANDATTRACRRASNGSTASAQWTPVGVCVDILRPLFRACPILPGWALRKRLVRAAAVEKALVAGDLEPSGSRDFSGDRAYRIGRKFRKRRGARRQVISARSCVGKQFGTHADHRDRNAR
jgi:hypothetical protein